MTDDVGPGRRVAVVTGAAQGLGEAIAGRFVTDGFRFASVTSMEDAAFLPGSVKYGDLPAMVGMLAPKPVWIAGETAASMGVTTGVYRVAGDTRALTFSRAKGDRVQAELVKWITHRRD